MMAIAKVKAIFKHQSGICLTGTSRRRGKERYAASHLIDLAMANVFYYWPAYRWSDLPDFADHVDWLDTCSDMGSICTEPVQH